MKDFILNVLLRYVFIIAILWILISSAIQAFKCPKYTRTELFLRIPQSYICNWTECE